MNDVPPNMHLPYPGFTHLGHFMPQTDINALHMLASKTWAARGRPLIIAEVGSFTGSSALALVNYAKTLYCIDTWAGAHNPDDSVDDIYRDHAPRAVLDAFMTNTRHVVERIGIMPETSLSAAKNLVNTRFDLVFLDGDHRYEAVKADIQAWLPLVRPGGVLCGHDYDTRPNPQFPGVVRAVREAFQNERGAGGMVRGFRVLGNVWWREV